MKKHILALAMGFLSCISVAQAQTVNFTNLNGTGDFGSTIAGVKQILQFNPAPGYGQRIYATAPLVATNKSQLRFSVINPTITNGTYQDAMVISTDGKIGIGTIFADVNPTNPNSPYDYAEYRLFVKDGIRTEKVKVDIGTGSWGDFVFKADYNLMPLTELQKYIRVHQHLPNVPTATEVEKQGLNVGEMQRLQMIKIEELTLYLLELKKENDQLRERVEKLENQVKNGQN